LHQTGFIYFNVFGVFLVNYLIIYDFTNAS